MPNPFKNRHLRTAAIAILIALAGVAALVILAHLADPRTTPPAVAPGNR